jgi:hypothetical protein
MQDYKNPFSTTQATAPVLEMDPSGQAGIYRDDEQNQKAPNQLAYPLETLNQFIGNMLTCLTQIRSTINVASNNPKTDIKATNRILDKIDKINLIAISIPEDLERLKL